ncbi:MAG: GTPase Era [Gammaproteobacteria bacterium]|nr:GTPase Era [Gammaproteobacteria bacterium]
MSRLPATPAATTASGQATADGHRCGFIAIAGRANVGKSTLLNRLVDDAVSIVTHKPQTTRHKINGILSLPAAQLVFVDTPGLQQRTGLALNRSMNKAVYQAVADADVVLFMVSAGRWQAEDQLVHELLQQSTTPVLLVVNQIDRMPDREQLLPWLDRYARDPLYRQVLLISALRGDGVDALLRCLPDYLPLSPPLYPTDQYSDRSVRFLAAELIREQLLRRMHKELPYGMHVEIEEFDEAARPLLIGAVIWVDRESHKGMLIGKGGQNLKQIGRAARQRIEKLLDTHVHLRLWVRVQEGWTDSDRLLQQCGLLSD